MNDVLLGPMRRVLLKRLETSDAGTRGLLVIDELALHTLELPHRKNKRMVSCILAGRYRCRMTWSPKFKRKLYSVTKVKGRSAIRMHAGNWAGDKRKGYRSSVLGCILLGMERGKVYGQQAVTESKRAMRKFERYMGGYPFELVILSEKNTGGT